METGDLHSNSSVSSFQKAQNPKLSEIKKWHQKILSGSHC